MQALGGLRGDSAGDELGELLADVLELRVATVDPRYARLQQKPLPDQLREKRHLVGGARAKLGHQTSLAISSRLAFVWWMRSLATIRLADIVSRRWRPTLKGVSFLKPTIPHTPIAP